MNEEHIRRHSQRVALQWAGTLFTGMAPAPQATQPYNAKALRKSLQAHTAHNEWRAYGDCLANLLLFFFGQFMVVTAPGPLKFLGGLISAIAAVRLFFLGHDAGHGTLSRFKALNNGLGRLVFLPSLTAYQSWVFSHNHHHYANSMASDLWAPLSLDSYRALNRWRRALYRLYRSPWGAGCYYLVKVWWQYFYLPSPRLLGIGNTQRLWPDALLVIGFSVVWPSLLYGLAVQTGQAYLPLCLAGFILPLALTNTVIGLVSYLHHTHPKVPWQQPMATALPSLVATAHVRFPAWLNWGLHYIMEHPAHHLCPGIPYHQLPAAQAQLETLLPEIMTTQDFSWRWYTECTRICKLYDFENHRWLNYDGKHFG